MPAPATMSAARRSHLLAAAALLICIYSLSRMPRIPSTPPTTTNHVSSQVLRAPKSHARSVPATPKSKAKIILTRDLYVAGYEKTHPELCPDFGVNIKLVVLVHSAPTNLPARMAIRLTWGGYLVRKNVSLAFVLGSPPDAWKSIIEFEDVIYRDMIIGHSIDSYSNLTLKTLSMLEWVAVYCRHTPTLMKTDDDLFVNAPRLLQFTSSRLPVKAKRTIWGKILRKVPARRVSRTKYYMPRIQYPGAIYPDFVSGAAYLMSGDCVQDLIEAAPVEPYMRLEDVFFTGVLASKLNITRKQVLEYRKRVVDRCALQKRMVQHKVSYREQFDLWNKLLEGQTMC